MDARLARKHTEDELPHRQSSWRRVTAHPAVMHYNRLILLVIVANIAVLVYGITQQGWLTGQGIALQTLSNMVLANLALAILVRQQYVINLLFRIATSAPTSWPLSVRRTLGKVYHFGGLHVGGALAGTIWFAVFVATLAIRLARGLPGVSTGMVALTGALLAVLLLMIVMSLPSIRARHHDAFERTHRFGGWTALLLFWLQSLMFIADQRGGASLGEAWIASPSFWVLLILTASILLPWLRLRRVPVEIEKPSSHVALTRFNHGVTPFAGSSTAISRSPLVEWHSFANVLTPGEDGFKLTISRAGDWTGDFIDDAPSHIWVKGIPTAGVGNIEKLFKRVVWIATGSGIGPCLPHLLSEEVPSRLVWSTRSPRQTYGDALVDEILAVQPDALIWNTNDRGRPDLVRLAYEAYRDFDAEAVICISNKKLTWQVVQGMESRGIPAYGAIWDS
ncbi:MAG: hypothetical protein H6649_05475 [Caldilineae bacterium]|nr:hypothetical protein [Anaerolineae bacterium]MCB9153492.1 hypothetical protein [Caldilineae bacterium]